MTNFAKKFYLVLFTLALFFLNICLVASATEQIEEKTTDNVTKSVTASAGESVVEDKPFTMTQTVNNNELMSLKLTAELGDPIAIYNLAHSYHHGTYSEVDLAQAKNWYEKAATTDSPSVRYKIGRMFESGVIFKKDINKAVEHYIFAAEAGDINAQANLGALYLAKKLPKNLAKKNSIKQGIRWSEKAAEQNSVQAQVNLAMTYQKGLLDKVDVNKAIYWFKAAAANNDAFSQYQLGLYYYHSKNYKEAFYWFDLASELHNKEAMLYLSMMFDKGLGVDKNREKSIALLKAAAAQGSEKAKAVLKQLSRK
ncbi:tetratricopeptide repeat protein [Colwellia sp. E150_009]